MVYLWHRPALMLGWNQSLSLERWSFVNTSDRSGFLCCARKHLKSRKPPNRHIRSYSEPALFYETGKEEFACRLKQTYNPGRWMLPSWQQSVQWSGPRPHMHIQGKISLQNRIQKIVMDLDLSRLLCIHRCTIYFYIPKEETDATILVNQCYQCYQLYCLNCMFVMTINVLDHCIVVVVM